MAIGLFIFQNVGTLNNLIFPSVEYLPLIVTSLFVAEILVCLLPPMLDSVSLQWHFVTRPAVSGFASSFQVPGRHITCVSNCGKRVHRTT